MALLHIFRPEIFSAWTVLEEQQELLRAGTSSGITTKAGGGRFGEDTYADENAYFSGTQRKLVTLK